jgi:hypothetical protein
MELDAKSQESKSEVMSALVKSAENSPQLKFEVLSASI